MVVHWPFRADMWCKGVQKLGEKTVAMRIMLDNFKVLYFARDSLEPYVEVRNWIKRIPLPFFVFSSNVQS